MRIGIIGTIFASITTVSCVSNQWIEDPIERLQVLFDEQPLVPVRGTEIYRYFFSPGEGIPAVIRIEHSETGTFVVGKSGWSRNRIEVRRDLSEEDWREFMLKVYETNFWLSDMYREQIYAWRTLPRSLGIESELPPQWPTTTFADGNGEHIIEASNGALYHAGSDGFFGESPIHQLARTMWNISQLEEELQ